MDTAGVRSQRGTGGVHAGDPRRRRSGGMGEATYPSFVFTPRAFLACLYGWKGVICWGATYRADPPPRDLSYRQLRTSLQPAPVLYSSGQWRPSTLSVVTSPPRRTGPLPSGRGDIAT